MEGYDRIAAVDSGECMLVVTSFNVGFARPFVRFASCNFNKLSLRLIDCQVEGYNRVAAVCVDECLCIVACLVVGYIVPFIRVASGVGKFGFSRLVDGYCQLCRSSTAVCSDASYRVGYGFVRCCSD